MPDMISAGTRFLRSIPSRTSCIDTMAWNVLAHRERCCASIASLA